jgi:hypothetical protein
MARIETNRMAAEIEGDFVVFLIGMRINKIWKVHKWWPVLSGMRRMLAELDAAGPDSGLLGHDRLGRFTIVQYWRSFEHLEHYARDKAKQHWPAWVAFNRRMKDCRGDVGIWHETYLVQAGQYEAIYSGMPPHGLALVSGWVPATGKRETAKQRLEKAELAREDSMGT